VGCVWVVSCGGRDGMELQWMKMDRFDVRASYTSLSIEFRAGIDQMRMFEHDVSSINHDSVRGS
jgi:hypothetical protein